MSRELWLQRQAAKLRRATRLRRRHGPQIREYKPGEWVHDCDGFNHKVVGRHNEDQYVFEDGRWSCGCPYGPTPAWSVQQIEEFWRYRYLPENIEALKKQDYWSEVDEQRHQRLLRGEPICDEMGRRLE